MRDSVMSKHFETIKIITKSFIDSATEEYRTCSPFAEFLTWATVFVTWSRYSQQYDKVDTQVSNLYKELDDKVEKQETIRSIIESYTKDGYYALFEREIEEDQKRIARY